MLMTSGLCTARAMRGAMYSGVYPEVGPTSTSVGSTASIFAETAFHIVRYWAGLSFCPNLGRYTLALEHRLVPKLPVADAVGGAIGIGDGAAILGDEAALVVVRDHARHVVTELGEGGVAHDPGGPAAIPHPFRRVIDVEHGSRAAREGDV